MVTQLGITPMLTVTPPNQNVPAPSGSTDFSITANIAWTASCDQGWCAVTPSGTGNGLITATYQENLTASQRIANITVLGNGLGPVVVTVTQGAATPTLLVTPPSQNVTVAAGTTNFTVASNSGWTASSNAAWCTVTPSGTGNGTIDAVYQENTGLDPRTATVTVAVNGITPVIVTVFQEGTVGMPERIAGNILIYPNPNRGKFSIMSEDHTVLQMDVELFTINGVKISAVKCIGKDSYSFDFSDRTKGNYILRISTLDGIVTRKIVME
jgi:hypothetical protein